MFTPKSPSTHAVETGLAERSKPHTHTHDHLSRSRWKGVGGGGECAPNGRRWRPRKTAWTSARHPEVWRYIQP